MDGFVLLKMTGRPLGQHQRSPCGGPGGSHKEELGRASPETSYSLKIKRKMTFLKKLFILYWIIVD